MGRFLTLLVLSDFESVARPVSPFEKGLNFQICLEYSSPEFLDLLIALNLDHVVLQAFRMDVSRWLSPAHDLCLQ